VQVELAKQLLWHVAQVIAGTVLVVSEIRFTLAAAAVPHHTSKANAGSERAPLQTAADKPTRAFPRLPAPTTTVRQSNHAVRAHPTKISKV
jgi:hypothetical protein